MDFLERTNAYSFKKKEEIIRLFKEGYSVKEVAEMTKSSMNTIYKYRQQYNEAQYQGEVRDIQKNLGAYIANSLKHHLEGMNKIARIAHEEDFIRSQNSRDLAELHKQLEHWTVSILSASNTLNQISEYAEVIEKQANTKKSVPRISGRD